jgi:adenosylcobinamide kinase / adenosylcobinamide-phosphate guanylyltransferase
MEPPAKPARQTLCYILTSPSLTSMSTIYLVTGGARSGKSSYAERLSLQLSPTPIYVATAAPIEGDADFARRIAKHQLDRRVKQWTATIEESLIISRHVEQFRGKVVLVDCLTLWLTNFMIREGLFSGDNGDDIDTTFVQDASERALADLQQEFDKLTEPWNCTYIFVTNELGSGTHASTLATRKFVDAQGWLNQYVARRAQKVIHMVCGCPNVIKNDSNHATHQTGPHVPPTQQLQEANMLDTFLSKRSMKMDPKGYFLIKVDREKCLICVSFHSCVVNDKGEFFDLDGNRLTCHGGNTPDPMKVWECRTAKEATFQVLEQWARAGELLCVGHAGYLGREVQKAEAALYQGFKYQQD